MNILSVTVFNLPVWYYFVPIYFVFCGIRNFINRRTIDKKMTAYQIGRHAGFFTVNMILIVCGFGLLFRIKAFYFIAIVNWFLWGIRPAILIGNAGVTGFIESVGVESEFVRSALMILSGLIYWAFRFGIVLFILMVPMKRLLF